MANTIAESERTREASDPVWRILSGTAAFGIGVFLCGSVGTYESTDPSWNAATGMDVQNLFGGTGAIVADLALQTLGFAAWMAGLALMVGGAMRAVLIGAPRLRRWFYGMLFIPVLAGALASFPVPASWPLWAGLGGIGRYALRAGCRAVQGAAPALPLAACRFLAWRNCRLPRLQRAGISAR